MKRITKNILVLAFIFICGRSQGQIAMGLDASMRFLSNGLGSQTALGYRFKSFFNDDGTVFYTVSLGLGLPKSYKTTTTGTSYDPVTGDQFNVTVPMTQKLTCFFAEVGYGKMFTGDYEDGGFMGFIAAEMLPWKVKNEYTYDRTTTTVYESEGEQNIAIHGKLGVGYMIKVNTLAIEPYVAYSLGATSSRAGQLSSFPNYPCIGLNLMYVIE